MFQFRRFPTYAYLIQRRLTEYCSAGFPHSVIPGSMPMCGSPRLIAACHDLLRLLMPRHSPCALFSLTFRRAPARHGQRILVLSELCRHQQKFCLAHCFTQFLKLHNLLCPLLLALNTSFCIVQFSRCQPSSLFQDQIETSAPRCFDPFLTSYWKFFSLPFPFKKKEVVGPSGLEPPTSRLSVVRSSQLSYGPSSSRTSHPSLPSYAESSLAPSLLLFGPNPLRWALARYREHLVEVTGLEPVTPCLQSRCSTS